MFPFLKSAPLLDETSVEWMFDSFAWALRNFDAAVFFNETILVTPSNAHFPGNESSAEAMSQLILSKVQAYAGMQHWPTRLVDPNITQGIAPPAQLSIDGPMRGKVGVLPAFVDDAQKLVITYSPDQLRDPEVMIAHFAHSLALYLGPTAQEAPPGGEENWQHVTELLAVFMGFGVVMADSANTTKIRSCSSCSGPAVERENFLSQYDITYALAIFCCIKGLSASDAVPHLKASLRPFFKKAIKDVQRRESQVQRLQEMAPVH